MNRRKWMQAAAGAVVSARGMHAFADRPNIVMILADDLGYTALNCHGRRYTRTPNLDRLAEEGVRFTSAYATPQCTIPPYYYPRARVEEPARESCS